MKWEIKSKQRIERSEFNASKLLDFLLEIRGITTEKERQQFLHPLLSDISAKNVGIDLKQLVSAVKRIRQAIVSEEQIVVFGDYDVDGICASAILWETLHHKTKKVMPYIPNRVDEGYGLSKIGIANVLLQYPDTKVIVTVDNGIVANEAVAFANEQGIDVIITDHHMPHEDQAHVLPKALAIVHTTKLCGAGIAWVLSKEFIDEDEVLQKEHMKDHLIFAALATIADMVPLVDSNRTIVKYGLPELRKTTRVGLRALFAEAGIDQLSIQTYQVGHQISPRLNAAGRMESAMDSLRLLCTRDVRRARELAEMLGEINRFRQEETVTSTEHALLQISNLSSDNASGKWQMEKLLIVAHESYPQGVIGLIAGKLAEKFYRPAIVIAIGETQSKASVRSVKGFNIIEFLRTHSEHFINVGGHPMAAGFTVDTKKIQSLKTILETAAREAIGDEYLMRSLAIDAELPLEVVTKDLLETISGLEPYGMGNYDPIFSSKAIVRDVRIMGKEGKHLKLQLSAEGNGQRVNVLEAIGFGMGEKGSDIRIGDEIEVAYTIDENEWNGRKNLQLKLRDIKEKK